MGCLGTAITIHMEAKETHLCHPGDKLHGKGSMIEVSGDERHAFFIHEFSHFVPEELFSIGQECFDLKVIRHLHLSDNKFLELLM
jgi:hypothetical protein